jgi:hypothetical protein
MAVLVGLYSPFAGQSERDALRFSMRSHGADLRLGEHFTLAEMASADGADEVLAHPALLMLLAALRREMGQPVTITSGYRSPHHNARIGGAPRSKHMLGMAADVQVAGARPGVVTRCLDAYHPGGLGLYDTFTHVDVAGRARRWDLRTR